MKILLLGKNGQLGWELCRTLPVLGNVTSVDYPEIDLAQPDQVRSILRQVRPEVIVNATAYTAVDKAESERDLAFAINAGGPAVIAEESRSLGAFLIHYSTDYVFDGTKGSLYTEEDLPTPLGIYGSSKLAGEQAIQSADMSYLILRTAWVYSTRQGGFVNKVLEWARKNKQLKIVDDQVSNPTWARTLAELTSVLLAGGLDRLRANSGLYHAAGAGFTSRFEWAKSILDLDPDRNEQLVKELLPAKTADFPTPATRPLFSALDCTCFETRFGLSLPPWQESLALAMG